MSQAIVCPHCLGPVEAGSTECPHCRHSMENGNPRGTLAYGSILAHRYTIGDFLSADGEGVLYQAVENAGVVRVTLKEYLPVTLAEDRDEDGSIRPKAGREVLYKTTRMDFVDLYHELMKITPATGLEAVLDVLEENNTAYAVMENPGGTPLSQYLASVGGHIPPAEARSMLQPVFEGVAAMHAAGLVHRGVSPENIRVLENGRARLSGYATLGLRTAGSALRAQLYEGYSAPEQYSSAEFEGRYTDSYALAAVFYRMVTGQAPVSAAQRLVAESNPTAASLMPAVPEWLSGVLEQALALKPSDRIQTVPVLMSSLTSPTAAQAIQGEKTRERENQRSMVNMMAAGLALLFILLCIVLWWVLRYRGWGSSSSESATSAVSSSSQAVTATEYVPDFVGMTYAQIQANGQYAGHYRFKLMEEASDTVAVGVIIRQEPAAGTAITSDTDREITVYVSTGPESVTMPDLSGWTQNDAVSELQNDGLIPSCVMVANDGSYASGCVVKTDPAAGESVKPGSTITVYIAADRDVAIPEATATPTPEPTATAASTPSVTPTPVPEIVD